MLKFAVVDIETTGGHKDDNRIMEVGIALMDGSEVVGTYHSLVDPGQPITPFVRELKGINDEMVVGQPQFGAIAEQVASLLEDRIFVAHNVQFDCKFITAELKRCCIKFNPPRLCTVKLSRRVFPGQPCYSLHKLTESLGLPDFHHHRALDDTMAAAEILKLALDKVGEAGVMKNVVNLSSAKKQAIGK